MAVLSTAQTMENIAWNILIIDDDEEDFLIARNMLREAKGRKFDVQWASTYAAGRDALFSRPFQAVLVDYDLGLHTGIELIREASERGYPAPLILLTGRGSYEVDLEAMQAGATMYLTKGEVNPLLLERSIRYAVERKQTEHALAAEKEWFRTTLASIGDAVITCDPQGQVSFLNPVAEGLTDWTSESALGLPLKEIFPIINEETGQPAVNPVEKVLKDGHVVGLANHTALVTRTGQIIPIEDSAAPIRSASGVILGAVMVFHDVTEKRRTEQALQAYTETLRTSEEKFSTVFQKAAYASILGTLPDATIVDVNEAWEKLYGYTKVEVVGKTIPELNLVVDPEQRQQMLAELMQNGYVHDFEMDIRLKDGQLRTIRVNFDMLEIDGQKYSLNTSYDITDHRQAEEALKASEARLREFMENTHDNFCTVDHAWRITYINRHFAEMVRADPKITIGKNFWEVFQLYEGTQVGENLRNTMVERKPVHFWHHGIYDERLLETSIIPTHEGLACFSIDQTDEIRYQQKLEAEHLRLEAILQALPVGVWITDADGKIIGKNEQADRMWAGEAPLVTIDQYPQYLAWDAKTGEKLEADEYPVAVAVQTGEQVEQKELRIRRFDGSEGYFLVSATPIKDRAGRTIGVVGINLDITERQQAEDALRLSEERYRVAVIHAPGVFSQTDRDLRYTWVYNPHPDFRASDVIGKRDDELEDSEDMRRLVARKQQVLGSGVGLREVLDFHRSDGVHTYDMTIEPLRGRDGKIIGVTTAAFDITQSKRAEQALRESEEHFRQLANAMPQLVWTAKADGTVDYYNNRYREYGGIVPAAGERWEWGPVLHPDDLQPTMEAWNHAVKTGEIYQIEHRVRMADGQYCWHLSRGIPKKDEAGNVVRWYGTATNIHAQKEIEEKIRQSNQELEQFAYVASHDLQEPLRKVILFGDSLRSQLGGNLTAAADDSLTRMQRAAQRMQVMIKGLLDLSRINTKGREFSAIDLKPVVEEAVEDLEASIEAENGQVQIADLPSVMGDAVQIRELFQNLISNAVKFHQPGVPPLVRVTGSVTGTRDAPEAEIRVKDNGMGFDPEDAKRIFQPFQRLHGKNAFEGTGLGLAICQKIVERHHGQIEVESAPGQGSTFIVRLPAR